MKGTADMTSEPTHGKRKTPQQRAKLASLLAQDVPVGEALRTAGWSEKQAAKGWEAVPELVLARLPAKAKKLVALGKTDKETRRNLVRGRLLSNTITGKDGGAMSAKILGSETELNMWQPEMNQGLIILHAPQYFLDHKEELLADCEESSSPQIAIERKAELLNSLEQTQDSLTRESS
jgi:hypothetical protein